MPLPRGLARFNRVVTNRLSRPIASYLPGFAVILHEGRVSGKAYRTPVNCWVDDQSAIVALTYGADTDWLKNLKAAGGGRVLARGNSYRLGAPMVLGSEGMSRMPALVRPVLHLIDVDRFAELPLLSPDRPT